MGVRFGLDGVGEVSVIPPPTPIKGQHTNSAPPIRCEFRGTPPLGRPECLSANMAGGCGCSHGHNSDSAGGVFRYAEFKHFLNSHDIDESGRRYPNVRSSAMCERRGLSASRPLPAAGPSAPVHICRQGG
jgi:hypothetical protein